MPTCMTTKFNLEKFLFNASTLLKTDNERLDFLLKASTTKLAYPS